MDRLKATLPISRPESASDDDLSSLSSQSTPNSSPFKSENLVGVDADAPNEQQIFSDSAMESTQVISASRTQIDNFMLSKPEEACIGEVGPPEVTQTSVPTAPQANGDVEDILPNKSNFDAEATASDPAMIAKISKDETTDLAGQRSPSVETPPKPGEKKRKRVAPSTDPSGQVNFDPPYTAATPDEKASWGGFCEIESNPGVFDHLLQEFGVNGVKIQEVYEIDESYLLTLPQPVYGLIFLFQYDPDLDAGESDDAECPSHVWFANQVSPNSCASVALVNMVNNIPNIDTGDKMRKFREFTQPFSPGFRGDAIANCSFIRQAHNLYARKIDMLNSDALLEDEWIQGQKRPKSNRPSKPSRPSKKKKSVQEVGANHFVAYMPINNEVWRLDGLNQYPQKLDACDADSWLATVAPWILARMTDTAGHGLQFSLLALVKDPIETRRADLISKIKFLSAIEQKLQAMKPDWRSFEEVNADTITSASPELGISAEDIFTTLLDEASSTKLEKFDDLDSLLELYRRIADDQAPIRAELRDLMQAQKEDEIRALDRQNDYVPVIQKWFGMLADNKALKDLVEGN